MNIDVVDTDGNFQTDTSKPVLKQEQRDFEEIWKVLSKDAKLVAIALSQYPSDITKETVDAMIAAENKNKNTHIDATKGFLELNRYGVLERMTVLERAEDKVKKFESLPKEEQEKIQSGKQLSFQEEVLLRQYQGAKGSIADYKRNPLDARWSRVGYSLPESFKIIAHQRTADIK